MGKEGETLRLLGSKAWKGRAETVLGPTPGLGANSALATEAPGPNAASAERQKESLATLTVPGLVPQGCTFILWNHRSPPLLPFLQFSSCSSGCPLAFSYKVLSWVSSGDLPGVIMVFR